MTLPTVMVVSTGIISLSLFITAITINAMKSDEQ